MKNLSIMFGKKLVTHQTGPEGREVKRLYVEEPSDIDKEFYLSCLVDRETSKIAFISSVEGGMDIEKVAKENPKREDLDISTFIRCATEVGGDYYDFIEFEDGSLLAICGDATGHGTASGMMVSITKAGLLGIDSSDPNFILKTLKAKEIYVPKIGLADGMVGQIIN